MTLVWCTKTDDWVDDNPNSSLTLIESRRKTITAKRTSPKEKHPLFEVAEKIHLYICKDLNWPTDIKQADSKRAYMRFYIHDEKLSYGYICYGTKGLQHYYTYGYTEQYKKPLKVWYEHDILAHMYGTMPNAHAPVRNEAIYCLVIHELAHYYDRFINKNNNPSDKHGVSYSEALDHLLTLYPMVETLKNISK